MRKLLGDYGASAAAAHPCPCVASKCWGSGEGVVCNRPCPYRDAAAIVRLDWPKAWLPPVIRRSLQP